MRQLSGGRVEWGVLVAMLVAGCAGASAPSTVPRGPREPERSASLLVPEALPPTLVRTAGPVAQGTPVFQTGHDGGFLDIDISPDGTLVLVASVDGEVSVLDFATGVTRASRRMWVSPARGGLRRARFDATGTRVLLVGNGPPYTETLFTWDLLTDSLVPGHSRDAGATPSATITTDGSLVVSTVTGVTEVRDAATLVTRRSVLLRLASGQPIISDHVWVSPSNARLLAARDVEFHYSDESQERLLNSPLRSLHLYDAEGALVTEIEPGGAPPPAPSDDGSPPVPGFRALAFRPGGGMLMTLTEAGVVQLRDPLTGALLQEVALPGRAADAMWSREGELLLVRDGGAEPLAHFVDPASGAVVASATTTVDGWPFATLRQQDGSLLVYTVKTLEAFSTTGEPRAHPLSPFVPASVGGGSLLRVTPQGERAVYVEDQTMHFMDLAAGRELAQRALSSGPNSVWGGLFVPGVGVLMSMRERGVLFRSGSATGVYCAGGETRLRGEGRSLRVVGAQEECGLDDVDRDDAPEPLFAEGGMVQAVSADGATRAVYRDTEVTVEDVRTERVRMRVPAADRTSPLCPECPVTLQLSPNGGLLAVYDQLLPLALFDTRTGRRVARLEMPARNAHWVDWSADGSHFTVSWVPRYNPDAQEETAAVATVIALYDRRGRRLVSVEGDPEENTGDLGAAFSPTHAVIFVGSRARVIELRRGTEIVLTVPGSVVAAVWHGPTLRLWARAEQDTLHALYAPGATTPYFQHEGTGTFTADARWVFRCRAGELERLRVEDLARTLFGACIETALFPSPDGRFVALPQGDHLRVVREDGVAIRLAVIGEPQSLTGYAVEEATGRFQVFGAAADEARVLYRQPGPATSTPVVPLREAASLAEAGLLQRFLGL